MKGMKCLKYDTKKTVGVYDVPVPVDDHDKDANEPTKQLSFSWSSKKLSRDSIIHKFEETDDDIQLVEHLRKKYSSHSNSGPSQNVNITTNPPDIKKLFDPMNQTFPGFNEHKTWPASTTEEVTIDFIKWPWWSWW